jgi:hypothetical protein
MKSKVWSGHKWMNTDRSCCHVRVITWTALRYSRFKTKITAHRYTLDVHKVWSFVIEQKQVDRRRVKLIPLIASLYLTVLYLAKTIIDKVCNKEHLTQFWKLHASLVHVFLYPDTHTHTQTHTLYPTCSVHIERISWEHYVHGMDTTTCNFKLNFFKGFPSLFISQTHTLIHNVA